MAEKDVPYDCVLIDLRSKPDWYSEMVPTELTPAARINGELVYESLDILKVHPKLPCDDSSCSLNPFPQYLLTDKCHAILSLIIWLRACLAMQRLEKEFPETPLMPADSGLRQETEELLSEAESLSGPGFR